MMNKKPKEGLLGFVRIFLLLQILSVVYAAVEIRLSVDEIWKKIQYKDKDSTTKYCSIERAANHYLGTYLNERWNEYGGVILKFEEDPSQFCIVAGEETEKIRDCLNDKFNLFREFFYDPDDLAASNGFFCDWNPIETVEVDPIPTNSVARLILPFEDLEKKINQDKLALTTIEFYNDRYKHILFLGFEGKFPESLLKDHPRIQTDSRCCERDCVVECYKALTAIINDVYEKLGYSSTTIAAPVTLVVLDAVEEQGAEILEDNTVFTELNNALVEETILGDEVDFEDENNQDNVIAAIEEQIVQQQEADSLGSLFATVSESVTITMDLCLEENDNVSAGIPLSPDGRNLVAKPNALIKEFNNYIEVTINEETNVLNVKLTNMTDGWKKTTLKLFFLYVNEEIEAGREDEARSQTALVKLTKQDCQAVEEKASQSLAQRQDLRNVNFPIVHSKIFYFPNELADIARSSGEDIADEIRNQSKALKKFFIETSTEGYNQGFNSFKINSFEYVGLRKVNPDFSNDDDSESMIEEYGTGQLSDFVITLYADNKNTTSFKEVFQKITETITRQMNEYIKSNDIKFVADEDKIYERVLKMKNQKSTLFNHQKALIVAVKSYINFNKVNLAISYATSEGLMYRPDPLVKVYLFINPFLGILLVGFALSVSLKFDAKGAPFAVVFPLSMCVFICNCLALDIPHIFVTYFYMTRYKPPSLDIRIAGTGLRYFLSKIEIKEEYQPSFSNYRCYSAGSERLGADKRRYRRRLLQSSLAAMTPFLIILPALKIICTFNTSINTGKGQIRFEGLFCRLKIDPSKVVGKIEVTAYDPKSTEIANISDNGELELKFRENQYGKLRQELTSIDKFVRKNFDTAAFKQRTKNCVVSVIGKNLKTTSIPDPFAEGCINSVERTFIAFTFLGLLMIASFLIFLRYSWPYILEETKTENFLPILCGERRGNKRTVATNVREEDITDLFKTLDDGGFWSHFFYKNQ
ncbi:unnamed protein product [Oikopleura dioica]|uniref:SSD domain-containing protein n=1 Tax=Oikopleura dioica TaxID=34765 RepID=E4YE95_OIKDI|nr:unnamed protein product [Oikopleura dioica]